MDKDVNDQERLLLLEKLNEAFEKIKDKEKIIEYIKTIPE